MASTFSVGLPQGRRLTGRAWRGDGAPLVLLHGLFDSSEGWADLAGRSARPCVAIDLPGFGGSDLPVEKRIDSYADDIAFALEEQGVRRATLVGHSLGGAVAAAVAERSPHIASLVLLAPAGFGRIRLAEALTAPVVIDVATLALPLALVNPLAVTAAYAAFVGHGRLPERELVARLSLRAARAPQGVRAATIALAAAGRDERRALAFGGPVGALWGTKDALVPAGHADGVRTALPQAKIEFWPGMGHHPQRERPAELADFVERWAGGVPLAAEAEAA
jgi:pimeloyl-ACP methyl ester carboxylesterase